MLMSVKNDSHCVVAVKKRANLLKWKEYMKQVTKFVEGGNGYSNVVEFSKSIGYIKHKPSSYKAKRVQRVDNREQTVEQPSKRKYVEKEPGQKPVGDP